MIGKSLLFFEFRLVPRGDLSMGDTGQFLGNELPPDRSHPVHEDLAVEVVEFVLHHTACELVEFFRHLPEILIIVM